MSSICGIDGFDTLSADEVEQRVVLNTYCANQLINKQGKNLVIPSYFSSIEKSAFRGKLINSVVIPESIKSIGKNSFQRNNLTFINIPKAFPTLVKAPFAQIISLLPTGSQTKVLEQEHFKETC